MNPAGIIITYIDWSNWKQWWFNIPLFLFQMTFMVVGAAIGKIKWKMKDPGLIDFIILLSFLPPAWLHILGISLPLWLRLFLFALLLIVGVAIYRSIDWAVVWRAAQSSHIRLVLEPVPDEEAVVDVEWADGHKAAIKTMEKVWLTANFGYPKMEIQPWRESWNDGKRFEYREPAFEPTLEFIEAMIEYAEKQVGKGYDSLQLFSFGLNFIFWLWPSWWGKEKLKWLNLRGGREVCSSGLVACLRWAYLIRYGWSAESAEKMLSEGYAEYGTIFFEGYDTAVIPPCLIVISKNWKKVAQ